MNTLYRRILLVVMAHDVTPPRYRRTLLRRLGVNVADSALVFSGLRLLERGKVVVGEGAFLNHDCLLESGGGIDIGDRASIGPRVMLLTSRHDTADERQRGGHRTLLPISVGQGAWLGAGVIVLPGVSIGAGAVVAAGSVVTHDVAAHSLVAGAPARSLRRLDGDAALPPPS